MSTLPNSFTIASTLLSTSTEFVMSTFEYLMRLNRLAGRTYNDLSQYYVFPWVIADYTSDTIDLRNPAIYRQFDYPMGAQLEYRREALKVYYSIIDLMN